MHIDRHYDMLECFKNEDLEPIRHNPKISFEEFSQLKRDDGEFQSGAEMLEEIVESLKKE